MQGASAGRIDFKEVASAALMSIETLIPRWLPDAVKSGPNWFARNPTRDDKQAGSFSVGINGKWSDFATGDAGGDLISLYAYIESCEQLDAAKQIALQLGMYPHLDLSGSGKVVSRPVASVKAAAKPKELEWHVISPVPAYAAPVPVAHRHRGKPEMQWDYKDANGQLLGRIMRFRTSDGGKDIVPFTWCEQEQTGKRDWRNKQFADPRPLYGLDRLAAKPADAWVILSEGEKCADVAHDVLPELVSMSWPGGGKAIKKVDWSPLAGRTVILWGDADSQREKRPKGTPDDVVMPYLEPQDQPGTKTMNDIAAILLGLGCDVRMVRIPLPGVMPDGWDVSDMVQADGKSADEVKAYIRENLCLPQQQAGASANDAAPVAEAGYSSMPDHGHDHDDWMSLLQRQKNGELRGSIANAYLILSHDRRWQGAVGYDEFSCQIVKLKAPPYLNGEAGKWSDADASKTLVWLQLQYDLPLSSSAMADEAISMVAWDNRFHAVRQWLESLPVWDGIKRLENFFTDVYNAEKNEFTQYVGQSMMVSAVARIFDPGCKVDEMVVLEGGQGAGKSTSIHDLFGSRWFIELTESPESKDFFMGLRGNWGVEIAEMNSFGKAELTKVKQAITCRVDKFRAPYDRHLSDHPRQCIFVGTTNAGEYLNDPTGGRRFLPIKCEGEVNLAYIRTNHAQLWAEAIHLYRQKFKWWDFPKDKAAEEQEKRYVGDVYEGLIARWVDGQAIGDFAYTNMQLTEMGEDGKPKRLHMSDVMKKALDIDVGKQTRAEQTRVGGVLARLGWKPRQVRRYGAMVRLYERVSVTM